MSKKTKDAGAAATSPTKANNAARAEALKRLQAKPAKAKAAKPKAAKSAKPAKTTPAKQSAPPRLSALDAAAQVLAASDKPMGSHDLIDAMAAKGLWKSPGGKTPAATLYAAILREIQAKKSEARFKKVERGMFAATARAMNGA